MSATKGKNETLPRPTETTMYLNRKAGVGKMSCAPQSQGRLMAGTRRAPVCLSRDLRSNSAVEIPPIPDPTPTPITDTPKSKEGDVPAVPEVPSDEFEKMHTAGQRTNEPQEEEEIPTEEEEKSGPRVIPQVTVTGGLTNCNSTPNPNLSKLAKARRVPKKGELQPEIELREEAKKTQKITASKTWYDLDNFKKDPDTPASKASNVVLKDSKSPDPFEATHEQSEAQLIGLISNTSSPESPLYHLRRSGTRKAANQRAYRHFVISLFESLWYVKEMRKVSEEVVLQQVLSLRRPPGLACISRSRPRSQQNAGARPRRNAGALRR
jgi:hypothetical protein